jgi:pilus assembly protein CpaE
MASAPRRRGPRGESGQASVDLIGAIPALLVAVLLAAQLIAAGHALWSAGLAARAGARASIVGGDPGRAARRALPTLLRDDARVSEDDAVSVRVSVPRLFPGLPEFHVASRSSLEAGGG